MEHKNFEDLMADYVRGLLDKKSAEELSAYINENEENRKKFIQEVEAFRYVRLAVLKDIDKTTAWKHLERKRKLRHILLILRRTVAASIVISISIFLYLKTSTPSPDEEILPGRTMAIMLSEQGIVHLESEICIKTTNGKSYALFCDTSEGKSGENPVCLARDCTTIRVPYGCTYYLTLADGTKVWMNSGSDLKFSHDFNREIREVWMSGELFFEVAHSDSPFVIHAEDLLIRDLGTSFNVTAYPEEDVFVTTLVSGSAQVEYKGTTIDLKPADQVFVNKKNGKIASMQVRAEQYISWRKGIFEFENMRLEQIALHLTRWYDINFEFARENTKDRRFTGVLKKDMPIDTLLHIIGKTTDVRFQRKSKTVYTIN